MAAHEHINKDQSGKYVRLHRGFAGMHHDSVDTDALGHHWVGDDNAVLADKFATDHLFDPSYGAYRKTGTVLTGLVHKRPIMDPTSEEHEKWANEGFGAVESEREVPLRKGTPVHIIGATDFSLDANDDQNHEFTPRIRGRA